MMLKPFILAIVSFALPAVAFVTVRAANAPLTLELLAQDPAKWIGTAPSAVRWSEDGKSIYFNWNPDAKDDPELFVIPREGGTPSRENVLEQIKKTNLSESILGQPIKFDEKGDLIGAKFFLFKVGAGGKYELVPNA